MNETIIYVGFYVHKDTIAVALADGGERGDVRAFGQITNTPAALSRLLTKLVQPGRALSSATKQVRAATVSSDSYRMPGTTVWSLRRRGSPKSPAIVSRRTAATPTIWRDYIAPGN